MFYSSLGALNASQRSYYGGGYARTYWLSNVQCSGSESMLAECDSAGWGVASWCYHRINDASVECEGKLIADFVEHISYVTMISM